MAHDETDGFLSRWSRRKAQSTQAEPEAPSAVRPLETPASTASTAPEAAAPAGQPAMSPTSPAHTAPELPTPTLEEAQALTPESDYTRFVLPNVRPDVRNAAFKQLFSDPQFNIMDGLDIYIDDYSQPNPLPLSLARKLTSAKLLNLFETPEETAARHAAEAAKQTAHTPQQPAVGETHTDASADTDTVAPLPTDPATHSVSPQSQSPAPEASSAATPPSTSTPQPRLPSPPAHPTSPDATP